MHRINSKLYFLYGIDCISFIDGLQLLCFSQELPYNFILYIYNRILHSISIATICATISRLDCKLVLTWNISRFLSCSLPLLKTAFYLGHWPAEAKEKETIPFCLLASLSSSEVQHCQNIYKEHVVKQSRKDK